MQPKTSTLLTDEQQLIQLIVFRTGMEEFCVPIDAVQEIIKVGPITPIPDAPPFMSGLINVRGDIVAIIDVKARFFLNHQGESPCKHIIITKQANGLFGLMVDEVIEVLRVKKTDINTTPSIIINIHEEYVSGVVVYENRLIILLDLSSVLSPDELVKLSNVMRTSNQQAEAIALESSAENTITTKKKKHK